MPRGGYQKPSDPAPASGPGKFSKRTDGAIASPDIDSEEGVQYGDRGKLEDAQRIAKAAVGAGARVNPTTDQRRMSGGPPQRGKLPPWLTQGEDTNPDQPATHGLDGGLGAGPEILAAGQPTPDEREVVLEFLVQNYGNEAARQMLAGLRSERNVSAQNAVAVPSAPMSDGLPSDEQDPSAGLQAAEMA